MKKLAMAAIVLSAFATAAVGALAIDTLRRPDADSCRVQVLTSEERIRFALWEANKVNGDRMAVFIKALGLEIAP